MAEQNKILLLDDEQDLLDMYREILSQLPSKPDVHTSNSGARALALLESESFALLISDLNMPKMDGLQVLSVVRRKFPKIKVIVMTSVMDEHYRARAYAMGVDLFWQKPGTTQEIELFKECVESLLARELEGGFRGVQSKSLVDIIQLECLSQSSSVLKITNAGFEGKVWVTNGDVIDAEAKNLTGEPAFKEIFSWKAGNFEILPADPGRARTIFNSYQGLLLDTAQAMDEAKNESSPTEGAVEGQPAGAHSPLSMLSRFNGVEFVLTARINEKTNCESWGLENPEPMAEWARKTQQTFHSLGEKLQTGEVNHFLAIGPQRHVGLAPRGEALLCVGFQRTLSMDEVRETLKSMVLKWAS